MPDGEIGLQAAPLLGLVWIFHIHQLALGGNRGEVTSPFAARATKGFLYIISRGGFIYLFIYLFFYIYIREWVALF